MLIALIIAGYLVTCVTAYLICRGYCRAKFGKWTCGDRRFFAMTSLAGPAALIATLPQLIGWWLSDDTREARW